MKKTKEKKTLFFPFNLSSTYTSKTIESKTSQSLLPSLFLTDTLFFITTLLLVFGLSNSSALSVSPGKMPNHDRFDVNLLSNEPSSIQSLIQDAKTLYQSTFNINTIDTDTNEKDLICTVAPGRVNLIGEHTDYTQGFVFPMAIEFSTVCVGTGKLDKSKTSTCQIISLNQKPNPKIISFQVSNNMVPLEMDHRDSWTNYVAGVVQRYMDDVLINAAKRNDSDNDADGEYSISFKIAVAGNVPLGSGLSSSASLEVSIATFIETLIKQSKEAIVNQCLDNIGPKEKALLCQKAENIFCNSPCGIMDQYVSAAGKAGTALLIDCRSLEFEKVEIGSKHSSSSSGAGGTDLTDDESEEKKVPVSPIMESNMNNKKGQPVFVICNSNVTHSIGGGEYPKRVAQCKAATDILSSLHGDRIQSLRDATIEDVEIANRKRKESENTPLMNDIIYRRAKHVVTENERTQLAKIALINGDWDKFGRLMNESHFSMKNDYEVSCDEVDILVDIAQSHPGVWGSRLTGGGFGGCTVSLVEKDAVESLCETLRKEYKKRTCIECLCFETTPGDGAREILL